MLVISICGEGVQSERAGGSEGEDVTQLERSTRVRELGLRGLVSTQQNSITKATTQNLCEFENVALLSISNMHAHLPHPEMWCKRRMLEFVRG